METTNRDGLETQSETSTTGAAGARDEHKTRLVPGLVIIAHPDLGRLGGEAPLVEVSKGSTAALSRHHPRFLPPIGDARPKPLGDSFLSRKPLALTPGPGPGEITLKRGVSPITVRIGGRPVEDRRVFSAQEIEAGVVLVLAGRVGLLLQPIPVIPLAGGADHGLVGHSSAMARLRREIEAAALLDVPVLLRGETGTGKELVARAVHEARPSPGPYLAVNLGALAPALAASELFGATRGAYTGADRRREGFFRRADGGTLFLDEIGEAPVEIQVMLLRSLETGRVQALGGAEETSVDVRVIAATDADLESAIEDGRFRPALLHRLAGYEIRVPPLRARRDDIPRLLLHFLRQESQALASEPIEGDGRRAPWPSAAVMVRLVMHDWPGNVRELKNVARRLAVLRHVEGETNPHTLLDQLLGQPEGASGHGVGKGRAKALQATAEEHPGDPGGKSGEEPSGDPAASGPGALPAEVSNPISGGRRGADVGSRELLDTLEQQDWRPGPAARALGLSRPTLYRLIERHPELRTAAEISAEELRQALDTHSSVAKAARALRVSPEGLQRQATALGFGKDLD